MTTVLYFFKQLPLKKPVVCFTAYSIINSEHYSLSMYYMSGYCVGPGYIMVTILEVYY